MKPTFLAVIVCIGAAVLEGALAGGRARQRLLALRMPPYSPPFPIWLVIGTVYYVICFIVLRHVLATGLVTLDLQVTFALLVLVLVANALWSVLFFRLCNLRLSFIAFFPYAVLVAALVFALWRIYPAGAALFIGYCVYLLYATWWGYRLWLLNSKRT